MTSYLEHKASDPNAGDKEWDRVKERDLDDWIEMVRKYEKETEILKNQNQMLMSLLKGMRS